MLLSALALLYTGILPLLTNRYTAKGRYYTWLFIILEFVFPFRPQFGNLFITLNSFTDHVPLIPIGNEVLLHLPVGDTIHSSLPASITWWQIVGAIWIIGVLLSFSTTHEAYPVYENGELGDEKTYIFYYRYEQKANLGHMMWNISIILK